MYVCLLIQKQLLLFSVGMSFILNRQMFQLPLASSLSSCTISVQLLHQYHIGNAFTFKFVEISIVYICFSDIIPAYLKRW